MQAGNPQYRQRDRQRLVRRWEQLAGGSEQRVEPGASLAVAAAQMGFGFVKD